MRIGHSLRRATALGLLFGVAAMCLLPAEPGVVSAQEKKEPKNAYAEGVALYRKGEYKQAAERFTEVITDDPKNGTAFNFRGSCSYMLKDYSGALKDFDRAVELRPKSVVVLVNRGLAYEALFKWREAVADYSAALKLDANYVNAYRGRARVYRRQLPSERGKADADDTTADILMAGKPEEVPDRDLEARVRTWLADAKRITFVVAVPQFQEVAPITVYVRVEVGSGSSRQQRGGLYRCSVSSEAAWKAVVAALAARAGVATDVREWEPHDGALFAEHRGVRVTFEPGHARELSVAPKRTLKLTAGVMDHFRIIRESDYPSDRTAVIITEAHDLLDEQIASFRGVEAILAANPWLKEKGESAFLVEAWEAEKPLSIAPLVRARPNPKDTLVLAALGTALVPSYVAVEWKHQFGIPLIGHEDMKLYRFCNYMYWGTNTDRWQGKDLKDAELVRNASVQARNQSSGQTFVKMLNNYACPILFIGYGHVGPHSYDEAYRKNLATADPYAKQHVANLKRLLPGEPTEWITTVSRRSVVSYLKEKKIGFVMLEPRRDPFLDSSAQLGTFYDYTALRKAQHDGKMGPYLERLRRTPTRGCTTMPDPAALADLLPTLEANGLPDAELYSPQARADQLADLLGDCGTILGCFPAGTVVRTESGSRAIETVRAGERVWAADPVTGKWSLRAVTESLSGAYEGDFVAVTTGSATVTATGGHPFWVASGDRLADRPAAEHIPATDARTTPSGRWVNARDLRAGDVLVSHDGAEVAVRSVAARTGRETVYTLRVADLHTFAVGTSGLLVHNNCARVPAKLFRDEDFGKNLAAHYKKLGREVPPQCAAHHLIPVAEAQQSELMKAVAARGLYNINRMQNGMFLPRTEAAAAAMRLPLHKGPHQAYSDYVAERLKKIDAEYKQAQKNPKTRWNDDQMLRRVTNLEKDLRRQLRRGKFDLGD